MTGGVGGGYGGMLRGLLFGLFFAAFWSCFSTKNNPAKPQKWRGPLGYQTGADHLGCKWGGLLLISLIAGPDKLARTTWVPNWRGRLRCETKFLRPQFFTATCKDQLGACFALLVRNIWAQDHLGSCSTGEEHLGSGPPGFLEWQTGPFVWNEQPTHTTKQKLSAKTNPPVGDRCKPNRCRHPRPRCSAGTWSPLELHPLPSLATESSEK